MMRKQLAASGITCGSCVKSFTIGSANAMNTNPISPRKIMLYKPVPPHRTRGAFRLLRAKILSNQRSRGVAEPPRRQDHKNHDANGNRVSGQRSRAKKTTDAHQPDPAGMRNCELQNSGK